MANLSTYLQQKILNWLLGNTGAGTAPTTVYVSLHTGDPAQTGANEVSGGSYARVAVATGTAQWTAPAASGTQQTSHNVNTITFPAPTGTWGTISYFGIWDAATAGNYLGGGALTANIAPLNGDSAPSFAAAAAVFNMQ